MYTAKRTFTAGKDSKGKRIFFEKGKRYKEVPEELLKYFDEKEKTFSK